MKKNNATKIRQISQAQQPRLPKRNGTIAIDAYDLPISDFLDTPTHDALLRWYQWAGKILATCPGDWTNPRDIPAVRAHYDRHFFHAAVDRSKALYDVRIENRTIAGVYTDVVTPGQGVFPEKNQRVLINLHGGGFTIGARLGGLLESIPVAALGRTKVVTVDYRMAPEHRFPAATDDVVAVYHALLKEHAPENIGIFGCSAGAVLTAQTIARLLNEGMPLPGAVGMLSAGASYWTHGDSTYFGAARFGQPLKVLAEHPYFENIDANDPLVAPLNFPEVLAKFPPSLLAAATRDHVLSAVVHTHSRLVALGVPADLHVWEGLDHAFFHDPDLPASRELHEVTSRFFDRHLGKR